MSNALLLAEPEASTRTFLERHLSNDGFEVMPAGGGCEALELVEQTQPDLVLFEMALPDGSALDFCRRIREGEPGRSWNRRVPVIVLGEADADAVDRVRAFDRGCDDFLSRPFVYDELLARIRAVLRRVKPVGEERIEVAELSVDCATRRVTVCGDTAALAGKEYELLLKLASDPERVFTKDELLRDVWGFRSPGRTRTLDSHASRLRRKLTRPDARPFVVNRWGVGYALVEGEQVRAA